MRNLVAKHMNTFCKPSLVGDKRGKINERLDEAEMYRVKSYGENYGDFINDLNDLEEE